MMMMSHLGHGCHINNIVTNIIFFTFSLFISSGPMIAVVGGEELVVKMAGGYGDEKLSNILVTGTLLCHDPCLPPHPITHHPVPGASVAVSCSHSTTTSSSNSSSGGNKIKKWNWVEGMTDEYGDFLIDLPSQLHTVPNLEKMCLVKVFQLPNNSQCSRPAFTGKHKGLILSSVRNGIRTYTAQTIHLTAPPKACTRRKDTVYVY